MADQTSVLRMAWAPVGGASRADAWLPGLSTVVSSAAGIGDTVRFGGAVTGSCQAGAVSATWRDSGWQAAVREQPLSMTVTCDELRIDVPVTWRAHLYLGWRDGLLLVSSDLRTLAAAMPVMAPAPAGIAAFLAGGRCTSGIAPSLYRGVWEVQPGHAIVVGARAALRCHRTWTPERDEEFDSQHLTAVTERLRGHLDELADRMLATRDRVACLFSGGLDSTLIAATLVRRAPERVVLFNVGSGLGTVAEEVLRARFLRTAATVSYAVDLPSDASLVRSLRATNAGRRAPHRIAVRARLRGDHRRRTEPRV